MYCCFCANVKLVSIATTPTADSATFVQCDCILFAPSVTPLDCCAAQRQFCDAQITIFLYNFSVLMWNCFGSMIVFILRCNKPKNNACGVLPNPDTPVHLAKGRFGSWLFSNSGRALESGVRSFRT
jgi:hypothetical protein